MRPRRRDHDVVPTGRAIATTPPLILTVLVATCSRETPQLTEEVPEPVPVSVPVITLEGGPRYEPGAVVKGRLVGLDKGKYELAWKDGTGTLWSGQFTGPGDTGFSFTLSLPRFVLNLLVLSASGTERATRPQSGQVFRVNLPSVGRKGPLHVFDPSNQGFAGLDGFPVNAVLWNLYLANVLPWDKAIVLNLAWHQAEGISPLLEQATAAISLGNWPPPESVFLQYAGTSPDFARFVRTKYSLRRAPDETALQKAAVAWGRPLGSWDEVAPPSSAAAMHAAGRSWAQWSDYLEFLEERTASFLGSATGDTARSLALGAPVGLFGMESPSGPGTPPYDVIGGIVDWRGGAFRPGMARLASEFLPPGRPLVSRDTSTPYAALRAGLSGSLIQVFTSEEREAALACEPLAHGLGRLLEVSNHPRPSSDEGTSPGAKVALVYSHPSVRASFLLDTAETTRKPEQGQVFPELPDYSWDRVWESWYALMADLGVPFVPVTEEDVASGELVSRRFRAAVLVRMLSISEDTVYALRDFADSGGILIADAGTGMFDGDLVRVRGSGAQKLFGVEHAADARFSEVGHRRRMIAQSGFRFVKSGGVPSWFAPRGPLGVGPAESGLELAGARAEGRFGEVPCLTVNRVGGGWAVTLNLAVSGYLDLRPLPHGGRAFRELVARALARARVRPAVELRYDERTYPPPSVDIWDAGAARLVVLTRDEHPTAGPARVGVRFTPRDPTGAPPAVYDALARTFLGWTSDVETEFAPGHVRVFALFPYQLKSILAEPLGLPPDCARSGPEAFELTLRKAGDATFEFHVVSVTVEAPDGARREELSTLVEVTGGAGEFVVPFAQSDPPGLWTLRLRDAATGVRAVRRFVR